MAKVRGPGGRVQTGLHRGGPKALLDRYKVEAELEESGYDLLAKAGKKRGFVMRGGEINTERMANVLLDEFRGGKLGRFTLELPADLEARNG